MPVRRNWEKLQAWYWKESILFTNLSVRCVGLELILINGRPIYLPAQIEQLSSRAIVVDLRNLWPFGIPYARLLVFWILE